MGPYLSQADRLQVVQRPVLEAFEHASMLPVFGVV